MKLEARVTKLEDIVTKHLTESGFIQTNLKWNTWLTGLIAAGVIAHWVKSFLAN